MLEIAANMNKWRGRHWLDEEKHMRFMEIYGHVFRWDVDREIWVLYEDGESDE